MPQDRTILFVCEHGAAKSIVAATYFNKIARELGLATQAIARGTYPDVELPPTTIAGLLEDGLIPIAPVPQKLTLADIESAQQVIAFCELPLEYEKIGVIQHWDDVPPVSKNYERARDAIFARLDQLILTLAPFKKGE